MSRPRTRFAPSPSGGLHIGGARTALFNWAYARRHGGQLVLRIEDTDEARSKPEFEAAILEGLEWLGIDWDEGPFRQSERGERYAEVVQQLIARDRAYRCTCSREDLEERKQATILAGGKWTYDRRCSQAAHGPDCGPHTVRIRVPESGALGWDDGVLGPSGQDASELGDAIIQRSDGRPLYHVAVVVDDLDMQIGEVIRGADHLGNTPLQLALYRALDAEPPRFAHVPLIVGQGGKKLSKREAAVSVQEYRSQGYLPDAVRNWLVRIGWSHGDQEIFSREEIAVQFDLASVNRSAAQADADKLAWLGQHYLKALPQTELVDALVPFLESATGRPVSASPELGRLADLLRERSHTLGEMAARAAFLVVAPTQYEEKAARKHLAADASPRLQALREGLLGVEPWDAEQLEPVFEAVREKLDVKMGRLAQPVRVAVTGSSASPGIYDTLAVLGKDETLRRIDAALDFIERA